MSNTASNTPPRFALGADRLSVVDTTLKSIHDNTTSLLLCRTTNSTDAEFIVSVLNSHEQLVTAAQAAKAIFERQGWLETSTDPEALALRELRAALSNAGAA